jgi:hypothetical protein
LGRDDGKGEIEKAMGTKGQISSGKESAMTTTDKTIERHIERAIDRFLADPPGSDFQRGYFDALIVIYREAMGRNDERLDAALKLRVPRPLPPGP